MKWFAGCDVALAADANMNVLDRGMGVSTLSWLMQDDLRTMRLITCKRRAQSGAWTSHGTRLSRTTSVSSRHVAMCGQLVHRCASLCKNMAPSGSQWFPSIEEAWRELFPPAGEVAHRHAGNVPPVVRGNGRHVKNKCVMRVKFFASLRFIRTLLLFIIGSGKPFLHPCTAWMTLLQQIVHTPMSGPCPQSLSGQLIAFQKMSCMPASGLGLIVSFRVLAASASLPRQYMARGDGSKLS